jgi:putative radical SAM enzyme (TIGR03279 family)
LVNRGLLIEAVDPAGIGAEVGVEPGDRVLAVNDGIVRDILDYRFLAGEEEVEVLVRKSGGEDWLLEIEKDYDDYLGLEFEEGGLGHTRNCGNRCIFCFVDQMPLKMRQSLYVKDDDYRLSFLQGNFITLTNVGQEELDRIVRYHLSPLYISVHTTNPVLRSTIMGNPRAALINDQLRVLAAAGIEMHTQVVLCPGVNDGPELGRTITDLAGLWPAVTSVALVPVGLTGFRADLKPLRSFGLDDAARLVDQVAQWQRNFQQDLGNPLVYAADEFYLLAHRDFPTADQYGGFPQTENGVGLVRLFLDQWDEVKLALPRRLPQPLRLTVATGRSAAGVLAPLMRELNQIHNLQIDLITADNKYFGGAVSVAGLLTGSDILAACRGRNNGDILVLPAAMLRSEDSVCLDGIMPWELARQLDVTVATAADPQELLNLINGNPTGGIWERDTNV